MIGFAGGLNLYTYVSGNPTRYVDPEGLRISFESGFSQNDVASWRNAIRSGPLGKQLWDSLDSRSDYEFVFVLKPPINSAEPMQAIIGKGDIEDHCGRKRLKPGRYELRVDLGKARNKELSSMRDGKSLDYIWFQMAHELAHAENALYAPQNYVEFYDGVIGGDSKFSGMARTEYSPMWKWNFPILKEHGLIRRIPIKPVLP